MRKFLESCGLPCNATIVGIIWFVAGSIVFYAGCVILLKWP